MNENSNEAAEGGEFEAVIFDLDGVLTDTAGLHAQSWKLMFDAYLKSEGMGDRLFDIREDYIHYVDGRPRYEGVANFLKSRGIELPWGDPEDSPEKDTVCGLGNRKNDLFHDLLRDAGVKIFEDAHEQLIRWRAAGLKTACVSSSKNMNEVLEVADLIDEFEERIDGSRALDLKLPGKPEPDTFLKAAELMGVEPARAVLIEDAVAGVKAGRAGGFGLVVGVDRQGDGDNLRKAGADVVVTNLRDVKLNGGEG